MFLYVALRLCGEEEVMMELWRGTSHFRWSSFTIIKYSLNFVSQIPKSVWLHGSRESLGLVSRKTPRRSVGMEITILWQEVAVRMFSNGILVDLFSGVHSRGKLYTMVCDGKWGSGSLVVDGACAAEEQTGPALVCIVTETWIFAK